MSRGRNKLSTTTMLVTPKLAKEMLTKNRNREIRPHRVQEFAGMIKDGKFRLTHHGIAFNEDGALIDGQHRLMAVMQAGIPIEVQVSHYGDDVDDWGYIPVDGSQPRNLSDHTGIDKKLIPTVRYIATIALGTNKVNPDQFIPFWEMYGKSVKGLYEAAPGCRGKMLTSAPARAAFAVYDPWGEPGTMETYRNFVTMKFPALSPSLLSVMRQIMTEDHIMQQALYRRQIFIRVLAALDSPESTKVIIKDPTARSVQIREKIRNDMASYGHKIAAN